jgi:hypothetical protein
MRIFLLCVMMLGFSLPASADAIKPGEKIYYNITKMGMKMGEATLTFVGEQSYKDQKAVLIIFNAKGFNFFDEEKIYLDPKTYKPIAVERDLNIFGKKEKIQEVYTEGHVKVLKEGQPEQTIDKAGWMDNIYGFIYSYRQTGAFKKDDRFAVRLPTKDVTIKMIKQTPLTAAGNKYNAFYMESDPSQYKLWFDASVHKLPLRISGSVGVANTVMTMTKYEE